MLSTEGAAKPFVMPAETSEILALEAINGVPISEIEKVMKSRNPEYSTAGFLGPDENLLEVLARDNDTVIQLGVTHEQLARNIDQLYTALNYQPTVSKFKFKSENDYYRFLRAEDMRVFRGIRTTLNNRNFVVRLNMYNRIAGCGSYVRSPFLDGYISSSEDIDVIDADSLLSEYGVDINNFDEYTNAFSTRKIPNMRVYNRKYPRAIIHLIGTYGFYQGKGRGYRQEPEDIAYFTNTLPSVSTILHR